MTPAEAQSRIAELRAQLTGHDELFSADGNPRIGEIESAAFKRELADLEARFPSEIESSKNSETLRLEGETESLTEEIAKLRRQVEHHRRLYEKAASEITDLEFDHLFKRLKKLEQRRESKKPISRRLPELPLGDSPTEQVGEDRTEGFERVKHRMAMTTLDNTYDETEVREFHERMAKQFGREDLAYSVEPKIDGASISVTYENGIFVRAVTRGDGEEGDDVTENVKAIANLPSALRAPVDLAMTPAPAFVEIRGEIFLRFAEFARINQAQQDAGLEAYANPRNLAAGSLKLLDQAEVKARGLEIVFYGLGFCEPADLVNSQAAWHEVLAQWGLPTLEHRRSVCGIDEVVAALRDLDQLRKTLPYATDGAVVKLDDFELQKRVGYRGDGQSSRKLSPRWACAYKFLPERAETKLNSITIQIGRTGVMTPVAELEPVQLAGTTVGRATLHNRDEIARKDIRVGDTVYVEKAGEIIPVVIGVNLARRTLQCVPYMFPAVCPACRTQAVKLPGEVAIRCPNPDCPAQLTGRIDYVASRGVLDLEGLGGVVAEKLVTTGAVRDLFDLFKLGLENLARLELGDPNKLTISGKAKKPPEIGDKNAARIIEAIERAKEFDLSRWIMAMQIRDVGSSTAQDLASLHGTLPALANSSVLPLIVRLAALEHERVEMSPHSRKNPPKDDLEKTARTARAAVRKIEIDDLKVQLKAIPAASKIGPDAARSIVAFFASSRGQDFMRRLGELAITPKWTRPSAGGAFEGKKFAVTGTLPSLSRDEAKSKIERAGGKVVGSVSSNTNYLLAGSEGGGKLNEAKALGIRIIDEAEFLQMLGAGR